MFLYRVYKCDIYKTISTTLSALSLQLSKTTLAQQFDSLDQDVKDQFLQLTNVFTSDSSSFSEQLIGDPDLTHNLIVIKLFSRNFVYQQFPA